jgi:two-component system CheB/CheR fusion protein
MKKISTTIESVTPQALRKRAEEVARKTADESSENIDDQSSAEIWQTLHELRVHQVELEMQNEELQRAHVELDTLRARYFDLYDLAPVGYVTVSKQGLILEANLTAAALLGVAKRALSKELLTRFIIKEDQDIYYRHRKELFETGKPQTCELRMVKIDGTAFWALLDATASQDEGGAPVCRVVLSDITKQKIMDDSIREKEVQYHHLADSGIALIWASRTDKLCNYFNVPWLKFTGRTFEQEMGNGWVEGVHPDDLESCVKTYVTAFDKREAFDMEYRLRHVSGEYRWIRDLGTPNYNNGGAFIGYIGHCFDISLQKETESQREAALEEIRKLNEDLEQKVNERTAELKVTISQLEELNRAFVGRELKMIELKKRIAELEKRIS